MSFVDVSAECLHGLVFVCIRICFAPSLSLSLCFSRVSSGERESVCVYMNSSDKDPSMTATGDSLLSAAVDPGRGQGAWREANGHRFPVR